ncbi:MAG: hypothetical protein Q8M56_11845, partial [Desulfobacterales bacterium]|nr:hypothetical protein [Desulfobacterales bacterium]
YPFYDSEKACIIIFIIMLVILLFGMAGIAAAHEDVQYAGYIWVPALLSILSLAVLISTSVRLIRHYLDRISK